LVSSQEVDFPAVLPATREFCEAGLQTELTGGDVVTIRREMDDQAGYIADSLQLEQERIAAHSRLPELQKRASDIRVENATKQHLIDRLGKIEGDSDERRFTAVRTEKLGLLDEFQKQVDECEAEVVDMKQRIDDQRMLVKATKLQLKLRVRSAKLDPRELGIERRNVQALEVGAREELAMLYIEMDSYVKRIGAIQDTLDSEKVGGLRRNVIGLKQRITAKKRAFDRWLRNVKRHPVPITDQTELERIRAETEGLDLEQILAEKRRDLLEARIRRSVGMLESWGIAIPPNTGNHESSLVYK
jgi:hypothetical protein